MTSKYSEVTHWNICHTLEHARDNLKVMLDNTVKQTFTEVIDGDLVEIEYAFVTRDRKALEDLNKIIATFY